VLFDEGAALGNRPVIFAGDFNTSAGPGAAAILRCLDDEGFIDALGSTETARRTSIHHEQPLDWIFVRNLTASQGTVVNVPRASDHFPLTAAVAIDRPVIGD
jgi:endonuclease/exonuclease/phosphatase (EEP) superfamily protein YafD